MQQSEDERRKKAAAVRLRKATTQNIINIVKYEYFATPVEPKRRVLLQYEDTICQFIEHKEWTGKYFTGNKQIEFWNCFKDELQFKTKLCGRIKELYRVIAQFFEEPRYECKQCFDAFDRTLSRESLEEHVKSEHPAESFRDCFPLYIDTAGTTF